MITLEEEEVVAYPAAFPAAQRDSPCCPRPYNEHQLQGDGNIWVYLGKRGQSQAGKAEK